MLKLKFLPTQFLKYLDYLQRTQCFRASQFNHGIFCRWIIERRNRKFGNVLIRDPTDLVLSRPVNLCSGISGVETQPRTQPNFHEEYRLQDGVGHSALFQVLFHLAFSRLKGKLYIHIGERDKDESLNPRSLRRIDETELAFAINGL